MESVNLFVEDAEQVLAVGAFADGGGEGAELCLVDEALAEGDLLGAGDLEALAVLDGVDEVGGFEQGVVGAGVEPGEAAAEHLCAQLAAMEIPGVDVGD